MRNPPNYDWNGKKQIKVKVRVTRDGVFSVCSAAAYDEVEVKGGEVMELYVPLHTDFQYEPFLFFFSYFSLVDSCW